MEEKGTKGGRITLLTTILVPFTYGRVLYFAVVQEVTLKQLERL